jgi:YD repeat-containing protein
MYCRRHGIRLEFQFYRIMKNILGIALFLMLNLAGHAQFYYKDVITVQQTNAQWNVYKTSKVRVVNVQSFEANNRPTEGFTVQQRITDNRMVTTTQSVSNGTSELTSTYNAAGRLTATVDTSEDFHSTTNYEYDAAGRVSVITNNSRSGEFTSTEVHVWKYDATGKPEQMLRIRNGSDTTYVSFTYDGKDVPVEEHAIRKGTKEPEIYYYYDAKNQLTDIVRYSQKARRLLPTHIFSYNADGRIAGMLLIPEGSNQYQRWYYDYDERGLKTRERVFNKQQQLMGKVEYSYQ